MRKLPWQSRRGGLEELVVAETVSHRQIWIYNLKGSFLSARSEALSVTALVFTQQWAGLDVGSLGGAHLKANTGPEDGHRDGVLWATETFCPGQYAGVPLPWMKDYTALKSGSCVKSLYKPFSSDPSINIALGVYQMQCWVLIVQNSDWAPLGQDFLDLTAVQRVTNLWFESCFVFLPESHNNLWELAPR